MLQTDLWQGCYKASWQGDITSQSFAHPAKYSKSLIGKIIQHAIDEGFVTPGDVVCDPFAGIGSGGLLCALHGLHWIGCELEAHFVAMAEGADCPGDSAPHPICADNGEHGPHHIVGNLEVWQQRYGHLSQWVPPIMVQGDARHLRQVLREAGLCVTSPPYNSGTVHDKGQDATRYYRRPGLNNWGSMANGHFETEAYSQNPANLGNLPPGSLDAAVTSPPYADGCTHTGGADPQPQHVRGGTLRYVQYGVEAAISSPPYGHALGKEHAYADQAKRAKDGHRPILTENGIPDPYYGSDPAQLGNLPTSSVEAVVTSPPYADRCANDNQRTLAREGLHQGHNEGDGHTYGCASGQLAAMPTTDTPTTFWEAARQILTELHAVLRDGGTAIFVTKNYIRDGAIVPFTEDWIRLATSCGFELLHRHRAMLVESHGTQTNLFDEADTIHETRRESFFRRLSRQKTGLSIDYEEVTCFRKVPRTNPLPPDEAWEQLPLVECAVTSPAYADSVNASSHGIDWTKTGPATGNRKRGAGTQHEATLRAQLAYGTHPAQLANMPAGKVEACLQVDCAITSPPYAGKGEVLGTHNGIDWTKTTGTGQRLTPGRQMQPYSTNPNNLGALPAGPRPSPGDAP